MDRDPHIDVLHLLGVARGGDNEALGRLLDLYRAYLKLLARMELGGRLQAKVDPSDLAQETLLEAHRGFTTFRGTSERELVEWLRQILTTRLAKLVRHYAGTKKRDIAREQQLQHDLDQSTDALGRLTSGSPSPSESLARREQAVLVADAIEALPPDFREFGEDTQGSPTSIASSPSGKVYVITRHLRSEGPGSARIRIHDPAQSDEPLASVELEPALASERWSIDVAPDGRTFVVSRGGRLALWDCNALRELRTICDDSKWKFSSLRFSPGSEFLAATANASGESCVFLWELPSWKKSKLELSSSNLMLAPLAFDSKGKCLAAGGNVEESDSVVHVWRKTSGEFQLDKPVLIHGEHNLTSLEFFRDGQSLAISGFNGVRLYELRTRQLRLLPRVTSASVTSMALAPNNAIIAAGGVGFIKLIDARTGDVAATIQIPTWAFSMDFLSDGKTLAVGGGDGQVYFLRARG